MFFQEKLVKMPNIHQKTRIERIQEELGGSASLDKQPEIALLDE